MDKYSDYSDYEEEDDFSEELSQYRHTKGSGSPGQGKGGPKDQGKRQSMKGLQKQQCKEHSEVGSLFMSDYENRFLRSPLVQ